MLKRIATALWGKFDSTEELKKFGFLAAIFGLIIATYWALRPIKDGIFSQIVGLDYQPWAKILSVFIVFPLVMIYSKLIDMFPRHKVFYVLVSLYAVLAFVFAYFLMSSEFGLPNTVAAPDRMLGWLWYVYVESFGSLIVALFWAFTTDSTMPDSAKRGFPIIALFGQLGNIVGPLFLSAKRLPFVNEGPIVAICGVLMIITAFMFWVMMNVVPSTQFQSYGVSNQEAGEEPGFFEGLKLLLTQRYLLGIFLIITIYESIITVIDFHFKKTIEITLGKAAVSGYLSDFAVMTGIVSMLCVLFGINNIQRRLGMKASLVMLPLMVTGAVMFIKLNPMWLAAAFWIMVFSKAVNYALNQPTLKQLYIPTTKETRYKSQAWIEMFGSRGSKGAGSAINSMRKGFTEKFGSIEGVSAFLTMSTMISGGLIIVWVMAALFVANSFNVAIKENKVVC